MSATAEKATRREIRRAFGDRAVANVAALDQRLTMAEAQIVALRLKVAALEKRPREYPAFNVGNCLQCGEFRTHGHVCPSVPTVNVAWASNGDEA